MLNKAKIWAKKYWWLVALGAFVIGVGSLSRAKERAKEIVKNPKNIVGA
jgi:membrane-associated PAP2 superfamily phosphatase